MLSRFEGNRIRATTEDGKEFTGTAEIFPSGYGLHEFGREEESVKLGDTHIFRSEIREIELLSRRSAPIDPRRFDELIGELLEGPYWIADILPEQVPADARGQYFAVEHYYLRPERLRALYRRFAEILLRLNCYDDMAVSFDSCESWEVNPEPERFTERLAELSGSGFLRAVFEVRRVMIDIEPGDIYMTVYDPDQQILERLRALTAAEGLFLWQPPKSD